MARAKESLYPPLPFYAVRALSTLSCIVVASILGDFSAQLVSDKYKIPWTFILVFLAAIVNLVVLIFTSLLSCCGRLSPIFSILLDIPIFFLWLFAISILTWNMYGALGHSCSITNWGNSEGVTVCNIYKLLYAFVVFANLAHIAQLVLDVRARRGQRRLGAYDKMRDSQDIKFNDLPPAAPRNIHDTPLASEASLPQQFQDDLREAEQRQPHLPPQFQDDQYEAEQRQQHLPQQFQDDPYETEQNRQYLQPQEQQQFYQQPPRAVSPQRSNSPYQDYREQPAGWRPTQRKPLNHSQSYASSHSNYSGDNYSINRSHRNNDQHYRPYESSSSMHMQDLSYQRPQYSNQYESDSQYSAYGHQQTGYHNGRY